ncbi:MAG: hypothetical protein CMB97_08385 [Flavobacteriaceae bacterium]|nr:hypothetical protein [Flavobacteriaceae bacterium]
MIKFKCQKAVAAMQRLFCWRTAISFQPSAIRLKNKLASCEGKVARNEFRDASCRRRFNAEKKSC